MYLILFHGRENPNDELDDWGLNGPMIGPVNISWTYGDIKVGDPKYGDFFELPVHQDMIEFDGKYYGDFTIVDNNQFKKEMYDQLERVINWQKAAKVLGHEDHLIF